MDPYVPWIHETGKHNDAQVIWSPQTQKKYDSRERVLCGEIRAPPKSTLQ